MYSSTLSHDKKLAFSNWSDSTVVAEGHLLKIIFHIEKLFMIENRLWIEVAIYHFCNGSCSEFHVQILRISEIFIFLLWSYLLFLWDFRFHVLKLYLNTIWKKKKNQGRNLNHIETLKEVYGYGFCTFEASYELWISDWKLWDKTILWIPQKLDLF